MTMHYHGKTIDTITPDEIAKGWISNKKRKPLAYGIYSDGDNVAYVCWEFLEARKTVKNITSEKFFSNVKNKDDKIKLINILNGVLSILEKNKIR